MKNQSDKLIFLKIKHLPIDQRAKFFRILKENHEIFENLMNLKTDEDITNYSKVVFKENEKSLNKLISEYKNDLKQLKNMQDIILVEESLINQMEK